MTPLAVPGRWRQVTIPVAFNWSGLGAGVRSIFNTGAVNYRVNGDVTVGTPVTRQRCLWKHQTTGCAWKQGRNGNT